VRFKPTIRTLGSIPRQIPLKTPETGTKQGVKRTAHPPKPYNRLFSPGDFCSTPVVTRKEPV
jgi:hypothetical protein